MAKGNAESLSDVLELARTRRLNGLMSIEHVQGGKIEEGEVFFQTGQPIHARVGRIVGQDALNWLLNWHKITYTIGTDESSQSVATPAVNNRNNAISTPSPIQTFVSPNALPSPMPVAEQKPVNGIDSLLSNT